jgi:hypothetical protein
VYGVYRKSQRQIDCPDGHTSAESAKVKRGGKHLVFKREKEAQAWVAVNDGDFFVRKVSKGVT